MPQHKPLDPRQQDLVNIVKAAHQTLAIARKTRSAELARRLAEEKLRAERELEEAQTRIKIELDAELARHGSNLDNSLIAAYNAGVPIRRIALDGFGNRYDGGVQQLLVKLRDDGRIGNREDWQRGSREEATPTVAFPKPLDVDRILAESTVPAPTFTAGRQLTLVEPDKEGRNGVVVSTVTLEMDPRDPWLSEVHKNARPGTPHLRATSCTLYEHPATGKLVAYESKETGDVMWDHPIARWVKDHPDEARAGFDAALAAQPLIVEPGVTIEDMQQVAKLADQLGLVEDSE